MSIPDDAIKYAMENGNGFEGDIILTAEQAAIIANGTKEDLISIRSAITVRKWPKLGSNVPIPYVLWSGYNTEERAAIARATKEIEKKTCIRYKRNLVLL